MKKINEDYYFFFIEKWWKTAGNGPFDYVSKSKKF
jgi:hypothetical protein